MTGGTRRITARGIWFDFRDDIGLLERFAVEDEGRTISPLHRAPWVGSEEPLQDDIDPHLARLGGDFFCAPFAAREENSPMHGWPANSRWNVLDADGGTLTAVLEARVFGARLQKRLVVRDDHPFVYQSHRFDGGMGSVTCANHANLSVRNGAHIRTSPKASWETPAEALEGDPSRGRSALSYPAKTNDPKDFPGANASVDVTRYPWGSEHEDLVIGVECQSSAFGWTAVTRIGHGDLYLSLRNPRQLPMTMFWHSNGGRDYPPWSGRHFGCLGVEEGAAENMLGVTKPDDLPVPGTISLSESVDVRHVTGAISWPTEEAVASVTPHHDALRVVGEKGATRLVPFDASFLSW